MNLGRCDAKRRNYTEDERVRSIIRVLPPPSRPTREELLADSSGLEEREPVDPPRYSSDIRSPPSAERPRITAYSALACAVLVIIALTLVGPPVPLPPKARTAPVYTTGP